MRSLIAKKFVWFWFFDTELKTALTDYLTGYKHLFQVSFPSGVYSQVAVHGIKRIHSKSLLWGRCWGCLCDDPYCGASPHISFSSTFSRDQEQSIDFVSCRCFIDAVSNALCVAHVVWELPQCTR